MYSGIRVKRIKTLLYMLSGVLCALAGILFTFRLATSIANNGTGLELDVVAVVLFAGVSIFGGKGSIVGVLLAVFTFAAIQNALLLINFNQSAAGIVTGGLLLASVLLPTALSRVRRLRRGPTGRAGDLPSQRAQARFDEGLQARDEPATSGDSHTWTYLPEARRAHGGGSRGM